MASCEDVVQQALVLKGVTKDKDVEELFLSKRKLNEIPNLQRFRFLQTLWLNGNNLRRVNCLGSNFRLRELHLHDNHLSDISGCLRHLSCLEVLTLNNNYLTCLAKVVGELDRMQALRRLDLFDNPLSLNPEYRLFVINSLPSLTHLDKTEVRKLERDTAKKIHHQGQQKVKDKVAFGRSAESSYLSRSIRSRRSLTRPETAANNYVKMIPSFESLEDAVTARQLTKSVNLYSSLDWSSVPRIQDRRQFFAKCQMPTFVTYVYQ